MLINGCVSSSAVLLLLAVAATACGRRHHVRKGTGLLIGESEDDVRDNVFNYDEQGGGEEDEVSLGRSDCEGPHTTRVPNVLTTDQCR